MLRQVLLAACAAACAASGPGGAPQGCSSGACLALDAEAADADSTSLLQVAAGRNAPQGPTGRSAPQTGDPAVSQIFPALVPVDASLVQDRDQGSSAPVGQILVDNVAGAFQAVQRVGTLLQFHKGDVFPEGYTKQRVPYADHFQGIQRIPGTNRLVMSGSGLTEHQAHLFMVEIASAAGDGMVLATAEGGGGVPATDRIIAVERFDAEFDHAGGFSVWGNFLAVGAEAGCPPAMRVVGKCEEKSRVHFFDVSDPVKFARLGYTLERPGATAGAVALIQELDGRFLLMVGRTNSAILDFYRSTGTSLAEDPGFSLLGTWYKESLTNDAITDSNFADYQNLNIVMQKGGQLFMCGLSRSRKGLASGSDFADLFSVIVPAAAGGAIVIRKLGTRHLTGTGGVNFYAGAGLFVASPQNLVIYGVDWVPRGDVITVNEFESGCSRDTGGNCAVFGCGSSRGPTDCIGRKCFCKPGYCSVDGVCRPSSA